MPTFYAYDDKGLRSSATAAAAGRLTGGATVVLGDVANAAVTRTVAAPYELFGPGDVQRLAAGAITRRFPAPNSSDAEETKLPLVEFAAPDLPWRYTPALAAANRLRPWLVLVVGKREPNDIVLRPDGRVTLGTAAQARHVLTESWRWAHVHEVAGHEPIARIVAPSDLAAACEYVACVVPAFTATGGDSWNASVAVTCELYDWWTFRTGPQGDFPELAAKLRRADLDAIEAEGGKPFGRAEVHYRHRTAVSTSTTLATAGALRLPRAPLADPDPADAPPSAVVASEVTALTRRIVTPDGRTVVTAPRYDAPFSDADATAAPVADAWIDQLRKDPRLRGAAGLGAWTAIEWQDRISDAAAAKAGDLAIAGDRIRHVALGVEASRSLWRRRLPPLPDNPGADPTATLAAAASRLAVLAPVLGRLVTGTNGTVLDAVAGRTPDLTAALLSSAARRAFRPGPARTALADQGAGGFGAVLVAANACGSAPDAAEIRPHGGTNRGAIKRAIFDAAKGNDALAGTILEALGDQPSVAQLAAALRALTPEASGTPDRDALADFLRRRDFPPVDRSVLEWGSWMTDRDRPEPCRPVDLVGLSDLVAGAVDPTVKRPPAVRRVLATLPGITHIGPVEIEPELDLPLWSFLAERAPDWMLPGAGDLPEDSVVGLATNPVFVESLLVGANHQATAELRWRNIPLVTRWSPLRKFWQRASGELDIVPIKSWPTGDSLGEPSLVPGGHGPEAVVAFRTSLFRRYPATVVYLYPKTGNWTPPLATDDLTAERISPTFSGTIGKDISFFGFPVAPEALAVHWVVLEEPPAGYRFYSAGNTPPLPAAQPPVDDPDATAAFFAYRRFAVPVRVLIGKLLEDTP